MAHLALGFWSFRDATEKPCGVLEAGSRHAIRLEEERLYVVPKATSSIIARRKCVLLSQKKEKKKRLALPWSKANENLRHFVYQDLLHFRKEYPPIDHS